MTASIVAVLVFACILGGSMIGLLLRSILPDHHLSAESKDVVKQSIAVIATMTALVLGLVTASAKSSFDSTDQAIRRSAAELLVLDRLLVRYGPETKGIRDLLQRSLVYRLHTTWPEDSTQLPTVDATDGTLLGETIEDQLRALSPQTDAQRWFQSRAVGMGADLMHSRWLVFGTASNSIPTPFLAALVCWLALIFGSFGLFAPRNMLVVAVQFLCALSVSTAIFLVLEMETPFEGVMKIPSAPLQYALTHLSQ